MIEIKGKFIVNIVAENSFHENNNIGSALKMSEKQSYYISDCFIHSLDLGFARFNEKIIIRNCVINSLYLVSGFLVKGLEFENNIVSQWVCCEAGIHNKEPFILKGNIFKRYFHFFDTVFEGPVVIEDNIFVEGSDLLGNQEEPTRTVFTLDTLIRNNIGRMDYNYDRYNELNLEFEYMKD